MVDAVCVLPGAGDVDVTGANLPRVARDAADERVAVAVNACTGEALREPDDALRRHVLRANRRNGHRVGGYLRLPVQPGLGRTGAGGWDAEGLQRERHDVVERGRRNDASEVAESRVLH